MQRATHIALHPLHLSALHGVALALHWRCTCVAPALHGYCMPPLLSLRLLAAGGALELGTAEAFGLHGGCQARWVDQLGYAPLPRGVRLAQDGAMMPRRKCQAFMRRTREAAE